MINHHYIKVKAPAEDVFPSLVLWGEAPWWPQGSPMVYTRLTEGADITPGCRYRQKVQKPFGPQWGVEVISVTPGRELSFRFLDGMFRGQYRVYLIPSGDGCEVHFLMDYEVVGAGNKVAWKLFAFGQHEESIRNILGALKAHIEGTPAAPADEEPEDAGRRELLLAAFKRKRKPNGLEP